MGPKTDFMLDPFLNGIVCQNGQKHWPRMDQTSVPKISSLGMISKSILDASLDGRLNHFDTIYNIGEATKVL